MGFLKSAIDDRISWAGEGWEGTLSIRFACKLYLGRVGAKARKRDRTSEEGRVAILRERAGNKLLITWSCRLASTIVGEYPEGISRKYCAGGKKGLWLSEGGARSELQHARISVLGAGSPMDRRLADQKKSSASRLGLARRTEGQRKPPLSSQVISFISYHRPRRQMKRFGRPAKNKTSIRHGSILPSGTKPTSHSPCPAPPAMVLIHLSGPMQIGPTPACMRHQAQVALPPARQLPESESNVRCSLPPTPEIFASWNETCHGSSDLPPFNPKSLPADKTLPAGALACSREHALCAYGGHWPLASLGRARIPRSSVAHP
jgi:hypothetical protein